MATYYLDEDLTTGLADGSDWTNAFQTFSAAMTGIGSMTEDTTLYIRSTGVVDSVRVVSTVVTNGYTLTFEGEFRSNLDIQYRV